MKSSIKFMLLVIFFTSSFISCSKDDNPSVIPATSIEGKWQFSKNGTVFNDQEFLVDYEHGQGCTKDYLDFLPNSVLKTYNHDDQSNCETIITTGAWTKIDNTLLLKSFGEEDINAEILELTATNLKVKFMLEGNVAILLFTRI